ncbi:3-oxoacyl-[acyl-carrier-protein] reductase FabG [Thalassovita gelatinovora]|uniref:3-oxoacyl-[acyl-carrier-protein] reductase FabG n=1 Tax=Thalassovita gelatinovora TaxID=53501 RepID=A0A0P1F9D5_THAGE|nr:SDR family oxidoreductase [Thalassovita gelatinovora]QIZ81171.1 SDR family oxidoreductase [Thalassovita gelatinovora]CUH64777.1 3-oxoacyl-[acyl-carrier-protein] reductase FabG [Thalassovita gelatinovora]SEP92218.1 NADP-dependent 3-hydroxy acid dehydrogenase YdfG [Thalassovita gelatinovora]
MPRNDPRLQQGVAVVTGAGAGLGRALSVELTRRGVTVAGVGRGEDGLKQTAELAGPAFHPLHVDVSDYEAVDAAFLKLANDLGDPVLLINNAAVYPRCDLLDETAESFMATVGINLGGVVACTQAALRGMVQTGFGRIVNVSTFADMFPLPASAAYTVSKGAARIYTRAALADLGDRFPDIVINDWMPGMLATKIGIPDGLDPAQSAVWGVEMALWHDRSLNGTVFERDHEIPPSRGLKGRIKDALLLRRAGPVRHL